ncbi:MAG: beta-glucan synthesis-associated, partial [Linnemannia gamsii]
SCRGLVNISSMLLILCGLILLILGYPIAQHQQHQHGGVAGSGLLGLLSKTSASTVQKASSPRTAAMMVDPDTPEEKKMTVAKDGQPWDLVFSDEFNQDGRGFGLGQDPHWEAVDLAPSAAMGTLEHYSSDKVTTRNGQLEITLQRDPTSPSSAKVHKRDRGGSEWKYTSGMLQSWNKMCFQGGILEVAVSLPGIPSKAGLKPRVFILGNLARYGFPASMDGVWPFSTLSTPLQCDTSSPLAANSTAPSSSLAQRLNGCSSGAASLGGISRGAPEMTLLETHYGVQMDPAAIAMATVKVASSSSTAFSGSSNSSTAVVETSTPQWVQPVDNRFFSSFSLSSSPLSNNKVQDEFVKVGLEYWPGSNSTNSNANDNDAYIQFSLNNQRQPPLLSHAHLQNHVSATSYSNNNDNWYKDATSLPSNTLIPQEPMSIVLSLGLLQDELLLDPELSYPAVMKIDYIRLYQPRQDQDAKEKGEMSGKRWLSCDPVDHPTAAYIRDHSRAYSDPGAGTWAEAGY